MSSDQQRQEDSFDVRSNGAAYCRETVATGTNGSCMQSQNTNVIESGHVQDRSASRTMLLPVANLSSTSTTFPFPPSNPRSVSSVPAPSSWMCLICRDLLCRPVRPPCGHHACHTCLRDYSDKVCQLFNLNFNIYVYFAEWNDR